MFKFVLFLVGFLIAFFFSYIMCTEHLSDELSGTVLEYKDQVKYLKNINEILHLRSIPKLPMCPPPPFRQTPRHLTFFTNLGQIPLYVGSSDGQMPHGWLVLQEALNLPSSSDYSTNFPFVKPFMQV